MMHEIMTGIGHGLGMYGFGPLTGLIILILAALGVIYIIQEITQNKQQEE
ncbi:MAG: hypothetical protein R6V35_01350 [Candidatus Nanohaloarchaea archaeon]